MTNRLDYETSAGTLSASDTYKQFSENLALAIEDLRTLSRSCALRKDHNAAAAWALCAENFRRISSVVEILAAHRANPSSIGYLNANKTSN